jgi:TPR repeat protein
MLKCSLLLLIVSLLAGCAVDPTNDNEARNTAASIDAANPENIVKRWGAIGQSMGRAYSDPPNYRAVKFSWIVPGVTASQEVYYVNLAPSKFVVRFDQAQNALIGYVAVGSNMAEIYKGKVQSDGSVKFEGKIFNGARIRLLNDREMMTNDLLGSAELLLSSAESGPARAAQAARQLPSPVAQAKAGAPAGRPGAAAPTKADAVEANIGVSREKSLSKAPEGEEGKKMYYTANAYARGTGVPQDLAKARMLFKKSYEAGFVPPMVTNAMVEGLKQESFLWVKNPANILITVNQNFTGVFEQSDGDSNDFFWRDDEYTFAAHAGERLHIQVKGVSRAKLNLMNNKRDILQVEVNDMKYLNFVAPDDGYYIVRVSGGQDDRDKPYSIRIAEDSPEFVMVAERNREAKNAREAQKRRESNEFWGNVATGLSLATQVVGETVQENAARRAADQAADQNRRRTLNLDNTLGQARNTAVQAPVAQRQAGVGPSEMQAPRRPQGQAQQAVPSAMVSPPAPIVASHATGPERQQYWEAVMVCTNPTGPRGNFSCLSPLNRRSGHLNDVSGSRTPQEMVDSSNAACPGARRLTSSSHLVWGCGFAATNNSNSMDRSAGITITGRELYFCSAKETSCRRTSP